MIWMTEVILQRGETYHDKPDWDAPGTLHHVIIRGIERKEIVKDDHDRQNFVYRMGTIALERRILQSWTAINIVAIQKRGQVYF